MMTKRTGLLSVTVLAAAGMTFASTAEAAFKAKYYTECYAPVKEARDMVPPPPADIAGKLQTAGQVADVVGKIPGLGGLGGFGGFGGAFGGGAKQVATYSNLLTDAAAFTQKMQKDYPDSASRIAAYGDKMSGDADKIGEAALKIDTAQTCYADAATALKAGTDAGEIKGSEVSSRQKEIVGGLGVAKSVLDDSRVTMDTNMKSYNEALTNDTSSMGVNLGSVAQSIAAARVASAANPIADPSNPYHAYYTQTNAYQQAWFDGYTKSGGDQNAAKLAALAAIQKDQAAGGAIPVKDYQQAYWAAQAQQASHGTPITANPVQALSALSALQSLGGLSGGGAAWVAANGGLGVLGNAIQGNTGAGQAAAAPAAAAAQGANIGQAMSTVNAMRGMSGGGAAWVAANGGIGMIGDAITGNGKKAEAAAAAQQAAATPEMTEAMKASLFKTSVDSSKFSDAYGLVAWQGQRNAEIAAAVTTP
jgi:hypothetical protein